MAVNQKTKDCALCGVVKLRASRVRLITYLNTETMQQYFQRLLAKQSEKRDIFKLMRVWSDKTGIVSLLTT